MSDTLSDIDSLTITRPEDFKLGVEEGAVVKKGSHFIFKQGDAFTSPLHVFCKPSYWKEVTVYGWAGSLSGAGRQHLQAGHWDLQFPGTHYEYFKIENIVGLEINTNAAWRKGSENVMWLNTKKYSYALQAPHPSYHDSWTFVVDSWKHATEFDVTFHQLDPRASRPDWCDLQREWKWAQDKRGPNSTRSSSKDIHKEPLPSTSKSRGRTSNSKRQASSAKRPKRPSRQRLTSGSAETSTRRTVPKRSATKPVYQEVESEVEDEEDAEEEDAEEEGAGEKGTEEEDTEEEDKDRNDQHENEDDDAEGDEQGSVERGGGMEVEDNEGSDSNEDQARAAEQPDQEMGGKGKAKEERGGKAKNKKKVRAKPSSIECIGMGMAPTDPRRDNRRAFGSHSSIARDSDDTALEDMVSRRMPSGNLGADPALVVPPTTEIGEASKKRKVAREALGKEKQSETGRKRPRAAGAGELAPTEVSRPGSTERETRASANPKATTGGEEPTLGPPSGSQALTSASDFVDSASESTQQTPIRRYPQSPTRAAGAPNTLQRPWSPPFTQPFPSTPVRSRALFTQSSEVSHTATDESGLSQAQTGPPSRSSQGSQGSTIPRTTEGVLVPVQASPTAAAAAACNAALLRRAIQPIGAELSLTRGTSALPISMAVARVTSPNVRSLSVPPIVRGDQENSALSVPTGSTGSTGMSFILGPLSHQLGNASLVAQVPVRGHSVPLTIPGSVGEGQRAAAAQLLNEERRRRLADTDVLILRGPRRQGREGQ